MTAGSPPPPDQGAPEEAALDDSQLPPGDWLKRNGLYLVVGAALIIFVIAKFGLAALGSGALVLVGLGFVIFLHELGHFAVAKWCDVHIETFSIGFGPALPGCSFQRGETTYKIALIPLGGYVKMVGEGPEDGDENPRSFKNKPVGQRMAIISAGVTMNVLLAAVCFVAVFTHGKERQPAIVGTVEPGGPLWQKGVPSGAEITQIDNLAASPERPLYFQDIQMKVIYSRAEAIKVTYKLPDGSTHQVEVEARVDKAIGIPRLGFAAPETTQLITERKGKRIGSPPVLADSPAAAARKPFPWHAGDFVTRVKGPDDKEPTSLPAVVANEPRSQGQYLYELAQQFKRLAGKPMEIWIQRNGLGEVEQVTTEPAEFRYGDSIVATTDPTQADDPNAVTELRADPWNPGTSQDGSQPRDAFQLSERLRKLAGRFIVFRVRRVDGSFAELLLPPGYQKSLGVQTTMGSVAALRDGSAAQRAGVQEGDVIRSVTLTAEKVEPGTIAATMLGLAGSPFGQGPLLAASGFLPEGRVSKAFSPGASQVTGESLAPVQLPDALRRWAESREGITAHLVVVRDGKEVVLPAMSWDKTWSSYRTRPTTSPARLAINELGIAYSVNTRVEQVLPTAPEGLQKGDVVKKMRAYYLDQESGTIEKGSWTDVGDNDWAMIYYLIQYPLLKKVELQVERDGRMLVDADDKPKEFTATPQNEESWASAERGIFLMPDSRTQKAQNLVDGVGLGLKDTYDNIRQIYNHLLGIVSGRISASKSLGGPITIARAAYSFAGEDIWEFLFFLGMISINLAVVNFLPIPVLDGGHMVFLLYEKLRGKPASEQVRIGATYVGLAMILSLMAFVIFLDIQRIISS